MANALPETSAVVQALKSAKPSSRVHAEAVEAVITRLAADPVHGLTVADAAKRLEKDGPNALPEPKGPNRLKQFFAQFTNPIVLTLLVAAVIAIVHGYVRTDGGLLLRFGDATAILLIVAINAVLGYYQEIRAEAALEALKRMQTPNARVRRGDEIKMLPATDLVAGDVLELEAGDAVPADARLLQTINLAAEEASLTGESMAAGKDARAAVADDAPIGDQANMLFVGTSIVRGKGRAVVVATGPRTELGKLSALISQSRDRTTPLEEKLDHFGKRILWACLALSALIFVRGMVAGDRPWHELLLEAVSLAVAAIPEGLPAITTITLALGMQRMAKRGAIIRKLAAVETLGAATVICSDKTGTLTQNQMTVREVYAGGAMFKVTGTGYDPKGDLFDEKDAKVEHPSRALVDLLSTVALCNNATLEQTNEGWRTIGDPTEGALLTLAAKGGLPRESMVSSHQVVKELPFDSDRKRMTIVTLDESGKEVVHSKGSADVLLPLCSSYATNEGHVPLDEAARKQILGVAERMSGEALRVLGVARREMPSRHHAGETKKEHDAHHVEDRPSVEIEQRLTFIGLVGMIDPPRPGVKEAIKQCADAQVRAVMITGDHKLTAVAIAKELGLWEEGALALTGTELEAMSEEALEEKVANVRVFARVTAAQKLRIVRALKKRGDVVAMTGDGVNDAPALREAHIGVAMGKDGTDVAREAADMVIADDNFATIVEAVREGRSIYRNIQKFIFFLLSSNMGLLVAVFVGSFLDASKVWPLTPLMILWINLVTNGLPALALGVDPPDDRQMMEPPRRSTAGLLGKREYLGILWVGVWMGGAALACYLWPGFDGGDQRAYQVRAIAFSLLALSPLFHAFNCRSPVTSIVLQRPLVSIPLVAAVVLSAGIHLVAVLVKPLWPVFRTYRMDGYAWSVMLLLSASIIPAFEAAKVVQRLAAPRRA